MASKDGKLANPDEIDIDDSGSEEGDESGDEYDERGAQPQRQTDDDDQHAAEFEPFHRENPFLTAIGLDSFWGE